MHWSHIEERRAVFREVREAAYRSARLDFAAERTKVGRERVGQPLAAPSGYRPAGAVCRPGEHYPERRGEGRIEGQNRVACRTGEQRTQPRVLKRASKAGGASQRGHAETSHKQWMP